MLLGRQEKYEGEVGTMRANFDSIPSSFLDAFLGAFLDVFLGASDLSRSVGSAATEAWAGLEVLRMV